MPDWKDYEGPTTYYDCRARLDGRGHYFLWYELDEYEGERDRIYVVKDRICTWPTLHELRAFCKHDGLNLKRIGGSRYDLDRIESWCAGPNAKTVRCRTFLDA